MRIIAAFARHTESTHNRDKRLSGYEADPPLTPLGIRQAYGLGRELANYELAAIYSSNSLRTVQVASIVAALHATPTPIEFDARLRETKLGQMTGLTREEAIERFPREQHRQSGMYDFTNIGGESLRDTVTRHHQVLKEIIKKHGQDCDPHDAPRVLIVGHGTSIRKTLMSLGRTDAMPVQGSITLHKICLSDLTHL